MSRTYRIQNIGFLEYAGIIVFVALAAIAYLFLSPKSKDVEVMVRLAEKDLIWIDNGSLRTNAASAVRAGMKEKDSLGRVIAEITRVNSFDQPSTESIYATKKTVYVTVRLRASYNERTGQYRYQGMTLQVGEWVRMTMQSTVISGLIVRVPSGQSEHVTWVTARAQLKFEGPFIHELFLETTGVDKAIAEAIVIGDAAKDSEGNVLAEILDKTVTPAIRTTWDIYGNVFNRRHPRKYDVMLTVRLAARRIGDGLYYLDSIPMKINASVPLFLSRIDIEPRITEIISVEE